MATVARPRYPHMLACRKRAFKSKPAKGIVIKKKPQNQAAALVFSDQSTGSIFDYDKKPQIQAAALVFSDQSISTGSIFDYDCLEEINSGSYGTVYSAREKRTGEIVAVKKEKGGFSKSTLMEINLLKSLKHPRIVQFKQVVVDDCDAGVYVVMEFFENNLLQYMKAKAPFALPDVKRLMRELLEGVRFLHRNRVMHRDLKPSNVLVSAQGELKICDFGLSRHFPTDSDPVCSPRIGTLWYIAPELLIGSGAYSAAVDMWSVGCIMAEFFLGEVLFKGETEIQHFRIVETILGLPRDELHDMFDSATLSNGGPVLSECGFDLLCQLLAYDPHDRISARDALDHEWFDET